MREFELAPGEHEVLVARKHWLLFAAELLPFAIMAVIPFALPNLLTLAPSLTSYSALFNYHDVVARAALGVWLLLAWTMAWSTFTRYYLNAWILTNMRICAIKQRGWFSREVSSLFLSRVQDATTDVTGVLPSLLNMGDITVQSAGAEDVFHMRSIPRPEQVRNIILRYVGEKAGEAPIHGQPISGAVL
jgi:hypothetical protein